MSQSPEGSSYRFNRERPGACSRRGAGGLNRPKALLIASTPAPAPAPAPAPKGLNRPKALLIASTPAPAPAPAPKGLNRPKALLIASTPAPAPAPAPKGLNRPKALLIASTELQVSQYLLGARKSQSPEGSSYRFNSREPGTQGRTRTHRSQSPEGSSYRFNKWKKDVRVPRKFPLSQSPEGSSYRFNWTTGRIIPCGPQLKISLNRPKALLIASTHQPYVVHATQRSEKVSIARRLFLSLQQT